MAQVTRRLKLNRETNRWEPRNFMADVGSERAHIFTICNNWLRKRYVLDNAKPLYIVLSDDLGAEDAYLVNDVGARFVLFGYCLKVHSPEGRCGYSTMVAGNLKEFVQVLKKRWKAPRIAIWFEQS